MDSRVQKVVKWYNSGSICLNTIYINVQRLVEAQKSLTFTKTGCFPFGSEAKFGFDRLLYRYQLK